MSTPNRPQRVDRPFGRRRLSDWERAAMQRGALSGQVRTLRRWMITSSVVGTAIFSVLAGYHTHATESAAAANVAPSPAVTAAVAATHDDSLFSDQAGGVALAPAPTQETQSSTTAGTPTPEATETPTPTPQPSTSSSTVALQTTSPYGTDGSSSGQIRTVTS